MKHKTISIKNFTGGFNVKIKPRGLTLLKDGETGMVTIRGEVPNRWWLRPICWILGHPKRWSSIYGVRYKQCKRCGKDFFHKKVYKRMPTYTGEVGSLYGVRFIRTRRLKSFLKN